MFEFTTYLIFQCFIDGALSDNLPNMNRNTITVSPFCGDADICPRDDIWEPSEQATVAGQIYLSQTSLILNWTNLKRAVHIVSPMSPEDLGKLACSGYEDALRFLLTRGECFLSSIFKFYVFIMHSTNVECKYFQLLVIKAVWFYTFNGLRIIYYMFKL